MSSPQEQNETSPSVLFLSIYSAKEHYAEHQIAQFQTWLGNTNDIYWLRGQGEESNVSVENNFINCPVDEVFENILRKRVTGLRYAVSRWDYDFYALTNTSTFVNVARVKKLLCGFEEDSYLAAASHGFYICPASGENVKFLAGNLIILSRRAALKLTEMNPEEWDGIADDIAITEFLKKEKCHLYYLNRNDLTDFRPFRIEIQHRIKSWDDSAVTINRFHEIHQIYTHRGAIFVQSYLQHYQKELKRFMFAYPPNKGLNSLRAVRFLVQQVYATVFNIYTLLHESPMK